MKRKLFVNIPVKDLEKTKHFFTALGFELNPRFTDEKAACLIVSDDAFFMLLSEPFFKTFTTREVCNAQTHAQALFAISCPSRAAVEEMFAKAVALGGKEAHAAEDHGFMYAHPFYDLDGHGWNLLWMDPAEV